ncbi:MAG: hypothetical protein BGO43_00085 [Gammaproteobacteria bacterium 39-13]|nr:beta-lactamase family protein [Gammaproteobacteria bacterium]OJV96665.1 MAG: hypothetical protein BGO43_00085 [Gammaproteobacteria bacterium 39-13]
MFNLTNIIMLALCIVMSPLMAYPTSETAKEEAIRTIVPALEKKIEEAMKSQGVPGVAVAIISKDKVYYLKTFGVKCLGKQDKITPTTLFQVASLSKPINATMLGILQHQGKLSLEDPVYHYIPGFGARKNQKQLKICHLMSHSTGILSNGFNEMIEAYAPRDKIMLRLQKAQPVAAPGKRFAYNNAMYGMIEDVISSASEKSFEKTLSEELFTPLGMTHACLGLQPMLSASDRAYPHIPNGRGKYMPAQNYSKGYYAFQAAGGVNASIQDLIPFLQLYLGKPSKIISKEGLEELTSPYVKNTTAVIVSEAKQGVIKNTFYGFGWHSMTYGTKKVIYHQGHLKGFRHFMGYLQDDIGIIVLTNAEKKHASKIAIKFFDLYTHA